jgi:hypothetical protein
MWAVELCPPSDQALISDGAFGRKSNACNNYISVILLFIRARAAAADAWDTAVKDKIS